MSNATQDSRNSGDNRRRRSRGGQNRRNNNHQDRRGEDRDPRGNRGDQEPRAEEFRPQGNRPPRKYSPPKLTLWQKILKALRLYKEPVRPPRPERKPEAPAAGGGEGQGRVKNNVRNTRSGEAAAPHEKRREDRGERGERADRGERNRNRENNRARGGDSSTVESARIYVGNLSYDVSESDLTDLFKGIGGVRSVEIVYNRSTHRSKGYGFVEMLHVDEAKRAVEVLHDQPFMGRKLTVSGAKSKGQDDREDLEERGHPRSEPVSVAVRRPVESVTPLQEPTPTAAVADLQETSPEIAVEAAVHNVEAVGAPDVIVEAVEHQVAEATDAEHTEEKQA